MKQFYIYFFKIEFQLNMSSLPKTNTPGPYDFIRKFFETFKKEKIQVLHNLLQKLENIPNLLCKANITLIPKPDEEITRRKTNNQNLS